MVRHDERTRTYLAGAAVLVGAVVGCSGERGVRWSKHE